MVLAASPSSRILLTASAAISASAIALSFYLYRRLAKEKENRWAERAGRIRAEQRAKPQSAFLTPIGTVHSVYGKRFGTPRQPGLVDTATAVISVHPGLKRALEGVEEFSHLWVLYEFNNNTTSTPATPSANPNQQFQGVRCLVQIPRVPELKRGIFACRSPHRPNNIGLSLVRLVAVDGLNLKVAGLDAIDGTPVLDIKPYHTLIEAVSQATIPAWVRKSAEFPRVLVMWTAARQLPSRSIANRKKYPWLSDEEILKVVEETLCTGDLRPPYMRESSDEFNGNLEIAGFTVKYTMSVRNTAEIVALEETTDSTDA